MLVMATDRFLIQLFTGEAGVGHFSVASDFAQQGLILMFSVVNLAAYPLAVQALEQGGRSEADLQLQENILLMLVPTLPATFGVALMAGPMANLFFGAAYVQEVSRLIPLIAVATLFSGIRSFYFDIAFQLGNRTGQQILPIGMAVVLNVLLNLWWIPRYGVIGAACATTAAQGGGMLASALIGGRIFPLPIPWSDLLRLILASVLMGLFLWVWPGGFSWGDLILEGFLALGIYILALLAFNPAGLRLRMCRALGGEGR
jgi:O-antigen/teichoic acid export membrane protein